MTKAIFFSLLFLISGCASTTASKKVKLSAMREPSFKKSDDYLNAFSISTGSMALYVTANPITSAYIRLLEQEYGAKNLDSDKVIQDRIKQQEGELTKNKLCFLVTLKTTGSIETGKISSYRAKLKVGDSLSEGALSNFRGADSVPKLLDNTSLGASWTNQTTACFAGQKIPESGKMELIIIPQIKNLANTSLAWELN